MMANHRFNSDAFSFFRARAAQLIDEGLYKKAARLLKHIDREQIRMNKQCLSVKRKVG